MNKTKKIIAGIGVGGIMITSATTPVHRSLSTAEIAALDSICAVDMNLENLGYLNERKEVLNTTIAEDSVNFSDSLLSNAIDAVTGLVDDNATSTTYLGVFDIPDSATRAVVISERENDALKAEAASVIKIRSEFFDGTEWVKDAKGNPIDPIGYETDNEIHNDKCGSPFNLSYNDASIPNGKGRKIAVWVERQFDISGNVTVLFK